MAKRLEYYKGVAEKMVENDGDRNRAFGMYDKAYHNEWELPSGVSELQWVRKTVTTEPHDSVAGGTRLLAATDPVIEYTPLYGNQDTKAKAAEWEKVLLWQLKSANRRRQAPIWRDYTHSALMYHEVTAQVIDLDYQIQQKQFEGASTNRLTALRRYGRYMINVYNPADVHVRYSNVMPEAVLLCQNVTASYILDQFGSMARGFKKAVEDDPYQTYELYDYMDYEAHAVWACPVNGDGKDVAIMTPKEHGLPFLPWVARVGGSTMETSERHKRHPLLYPVITSGGWDTANIVESLQVGRMISMAAAPDYKEEGVNEEATQIDYDLPGGIAKVAPGNQLTPLPPPQMNQGLMEIANRFANRMLISTGGNIMQGVEARSGQSYAALNLLTQISVGTLRPYKELAEASIADTCELMLLWAHYTKNDIHAWGTGKEAGAQLVIMADEIEPEAIYIQAELKPDVVTDRIQRINAASMAVQNLGLSKERGLKEAGVEDPQAELKQHYYELILEAMVQDKLKRQAAMTDIELQTMAQAAAMQAQSMQQQMAQPPEVGMMQPPGQPGVEGMGFDPNMGGLPPAMAQPGATREMQMGEDMYGMAGADMEAMQ